MPFLGRFFPWVPIVPAIDVAPCQLEGHCSGGSSGGTSITLAKGISEIQVDEHEFVPELLVIVSVGNSKCRTNTSDDL